MQEGRGCGFKGLEGRGWHPIGRTGDTFRHELRECPISVLARHSVSVSLTYDWIAMRSLPVPWDQLSGRVWQCMKVLRGEHEWHKAQRIKREVKSDADDA